jgi:hypothetical protein
VTERDLSEIEAAEAAEAEPLDAPPKGKTRDETRSDAS